MLGRLQSRSMVAGEPMRRSGKPRDCAPSGSDENAELGGGLALECGVEAGERLLYDAPGGHVSSIVTIPNDLNRHYRRKCYQEHDTAGMQGDLRGPGGASPCPVDEEMRSKGLAGLPGVVVRAG